MKRGTPTNRNAKHPLSSQPGYASRWIGSGSLIAPTAFLAPLVDRFYRFIYPKAWKKNILEK